LQRRSGGLTTAPQRQQDQSAKSPIQQIQKQLRMPAVETAPGIHVEGYPHQQLGTVERGAATQYPAIGGSHYRGAVIDQMGHWQTVLHSAQDRHVAVLEGLRGLAEPVVLG